MLKFGCLSFCVKVEKLKQGAVTMLCCMKPPHPPPSNGPTYLTLCHCCLATPFFSPILSCSNRCSLNFSRFWKESVEIQATIGDQAQVEKQRALYLLSLPKFSAQFMITYRIFHSMALYLKAGCSYRYRVSPNCTTTICGNTLQTFKVSSLRPLWFFDDPQNAVQLSDLA